MHKNAKGFGTFWGSIQTPCGRPAWEFCAWILAGWIRLPPLMVWNWVSVLHASILDTFIFGSLKLDSDVMRPQMRRSLWESESSTSAS